MKTNNFCPLFYSQEWPEHEVATCPQCHAAWQALDAEPAPDAIETVAPHQSGGN